MSAAPQCSSGSYELRFGYTNWEGRNSERRVQPISVRYGQSKWHPRDGWLMLAFDIDKNEEREFSMRDMVMVERSDPIGGVAQAPALDRYQVAKLVYATWLDADFITENHFAWFDAGKNNPESCVHYSNVAKALKVADRILGLTPSVSSTNRVGLLDPGIDGPYNEPCEHKSVHDGPRVEMRWGSAPTQVCDCGMWRINLHVPGLWREPPVTSTHRGTP